MKKVSHRAIKKLMCPVLPCIIATGGGKSDPEKERQKETASQQVTSKQLQREKRSCSFSFEATQASNEGRPGGWGGVEPCPQTHTIPVAFFPPAYR